MMLDKPDGRFRCLVCGQEWDGKQLYLYPYRAGVLRCGNLMCGGPCSRINNTTRPSWDSYFLSIAQQVATRSTCDRARVGAVIVKDKRVLTTGYNGSPKGLPHCDDVGHLMVDGHCVRTLHAEQNAIIQAALHGVSVAGGTLYVTHQPCLICAKMLINAGIVRVAYIGDYPDQLSLEFLEAAGVAVRNIE